MTFVNEVMLLQPSIFAASSSSFGMDRKYVLRIIILNGIPRVASARIGAI